MLTKIQLTEEKETLLITLYAKALDYRSGHSILHDKAADEILRNLNIDPAKYQGYGHEAIVVRARQFDIWVREFLSKNDNAIVLNLGCGLDTRYVRIQPPASVDWYDLDYPEVIELRKEFYSMRPGYHMIASSVTEPGWINDLPRHRPVMIVAEGLFEYLEEDAVKAVLHRLTEHFPHGSIAFDVMSSFAIRSGQARLKNEFNAVHKWAVDRVSDVDKLNPGMQRVAAISPFSFSRTKGLSGSRRALFGVLALVPSFRNMLRVLCYRF
ncbi:MAG TPA: class I SAM-dependent methyltransferase [Puia sp.]|nr:class I SAM-dependent methyltransferase [Puia sp.]